MNKDVWAGLLMTAVGLIIMLVLIPQGVVEPKKIKYAALSPSYYPRIVAVVLLVLGALVALRSWWSNRSSGAVAESDTQSERHPNAFARIAIVFILLGIYAATVTSLGFIVSSALILLATFWLAGERRIHLMLSLAIILPFGLYFFFLKIAAVPIPSGVLAPWLASI